MRSNNYRALKQKFVADLNGGSLGEINAVTFALTTAIIAWSALQAKQRFFTPYTPSAFVADWLINCGAVLFAITVYSKNPLLLNGLVLLPAFVALLSPTSPSPSSGSKRPKPASVKSVDTKGQDAVQELLPVKPFVTMYRGSMMVITCAAILAVDFKIFPRRFAKVENWGTSLMDLGVGSFVFSSGVVSARSVLKSQGKPASLFNRLKVAFRHSFTLLVLGVIRLISVKGVKYAEHVSEYGVHWNFFFTLGLLPPFVALFQSAFALIPSYPVLALLVGATYETLLHFTSLTAYIIGAPRENLISMNREGICSFVGYLAIFLAGQGAGMIVLPRETALLEHKSAEKGIISRIFASRHTPIGKLVICTISYLSLFLLTTTYEGLNLRVSRRIANLPYVLWIAAYNSGHLILLMLSEKFFFPNVYSSTPITEASLADERNKTKHATSRVLHAFNRNGLAIFLLANLLTGAVNLSFRTIEMDTVRSMAILVSYMALLGGIAVGLDLRNINVKI
ncbi:GPI-anchored wall transfer protein 1 [Microthyrium microscopicum]|uniref:GPI-anchored wall transfer protein n=1 Tax=Microthyrium microscopicum TaxID=703497 RepID=A0A6A6UB26_9PEZI|nr:GPI-anchored wall transfer protein 1 [Microthyrium microscopicum]